VLQPLVLPKEVFDLSPMWEYQCPTCQTYAEPPISFCSCCKTVFNEEKWRVPPRKKTIQIAVLKYFTSLVGIDFNTLTFKDEKAMNEYAHKVLAPKLSPEQKELLFKYFTVLFAHGFEGGNFDTDPETGYAWTGTSGTPTVQSTIKHHGTYAMYVNATEYAYKTFTAQSTIYARQYVRFAQDIDTGDVTFLRFKAGGTNIFGLQRRNIAGTKYWGTVRFLGGSWGYGPTSTTPTFSLNTWYCIEIKALISPTNGEYRVWFDGVENTDLTITGNTGSSSSNVDTFWCGFSYLDTTALAYYDCVVVADTYIGLEPFRFVQNLSVLSHRPMVRIVGFPRRFINNLSVIKDVFSFIYTPLVIPVRYFTENLSILSDRFSRVVAYKRRYLEDLSILKDVFSFVYVPVLKIYRLIQRLIIQAILVRRTVYSRKFISVTFIQDVLRRFIGFPRRLKQDLSSISSIFRRRVAFLRRVRLDLSVIRDVFSFIYVPIIKIYKFIQQVIIRDVFVRRASYIRKTVNTTVISDVFKRVVGFPRRLTQNLSTLGVRFIRKATYLRRLVQNLSVLKEVFSFIRVPLVKVYRLIQLIIIQAVFVRRVFYVRKIVNSTIIQDLLKRVAGFPRRLIQNLSVISLRFLRRVAYRRRLTQTTFISDVLRRIVGFPRKLIQNLSTIRDVFIRRVNYLRRLSQLTYIQDKFSFVYVAFVRLYRLVQTIVISSIFRRTTTYTRKLRQDLSVLHDVFTSIYIVLVRVYRFLQNLSVIGDVFRYEVITPAIEVIRRKLTQVQAEIQDLYEKVKKKAEFVLRGR